MIYTAILTNLHTTGEFGVVYKAQYTEPEGDIGYKTSTVAVKTLKGKQNFLFRQQHLQCGVDIQPRFLRQQSSEQDYGGKHQDEAL